MLGFSPEKKVIFFRPGRTGAVYSLPAKEYITMKTLLKIQESLVCETKHPVIYIEDRRIKPRRQPFI